MIRTEGSLLIVVTRPAGIKIGSLVSKLYSDTQQFHRPIPTTTRPCRNGEKDGLDYYFITNSEFDAMVEKNSFVEWVQVHGHYYGLSKAGIDEVLKGDKDILCEFDILGVRNIRKLYPEAITIFVTVQTEKQLMDRLSHDFADILGTTAVQRIKTAAIKEFNKVDEYDYLVIDEPAGSDETVQTILSIVRAEHMRVNKLPPPIQKPMVFLSYAKDDKVQVKDLYDRLRSEDILPWLDEIDIPPGKNWQDEIKRAIRASDFFLACLSTKSINKRGYVQKEIRLGLEELDLMPESKIFLIPVRLEECRVPDRLACNQWVNLFMTGGFEKLVRVLKEEKPDHSF